MADDGHEEPPVLPTAVDLHEPKFPPPYPSQNITDRTHGTSPKPSATDDRVASDASEKIDTPQNNNHKSGKCSGLSNLPRLETEQNMLAPPRQSLQKSATERPRPSGRGSWNSLLGRRRAGTAGGNTGKPPQLERQVTLTFDPYSSDSSSSDEDEPLSPAGLDAEASRPQQKERTDSRQRVSSPRPFSRFKLANEHFNTKGKVSKLDGRLKLSIHETVNSGYFAKTLGAGLKHLKGGEDVESLKSPVEDADVNAGKIPPEEDEMEHNPSRRIKLNIVVIVIGSRGDIQPFLKVGKILKEDYGHRVRIATHPAFKKFVEEDSGLEFFSVGGDPSELMAFMVKNPGLIPNVDTIKEGEIGKRRAAMYEMFQGMWRACVNSTDDENDHENLKMMGRKHSFVADAIIANPPSFAPPHIAERLGVPLHMMFTFPYSPTVQFPHPLANVKASNVDAKYTNFMSYPLVEMMTWQGLGDLINRFRAKTLCLEEVSTLWAPGQLYRLKVPYTYMWSPGLVPKPQDWGPEIDVSGFVFLDLASSFKPPEDLMRFLDSGPPPIYIGFGSIVVDDPDKFTKLIFEAVKLAGVRALVSKGWGGFGSNETTPDNIFMLENTPHDWLFPRVTAVIHHGGAGTTAIGLKCGKPTMIVPFFGDQPFWGAMVAKARAGAHECIPYKKLTAERLAEGIKQCLTDEARENVQKIADSIANEGDGALNAVRSFHRSLPLQGEGSMRCDIIENRVATWKLKNTALKLSPLAAEMLVEWKKVKWNELRLLRHYEWNDFGGPGEPVTGGWGAIVGTMGDIATGVGLVPLKMARSVKQRERYYEKRYRIKKRQKHSKKTLARANAEILSGGTNTLTNGMVMDGASGSRPLKSLERRETSLSKLSEPEDWLAEELAQEAGHGFKKTGTAILLSPMHFTLAITQGFHNAPRLYGDDTVRRPPRITGFHSGLRAGRDEFVYGIHDGVTGLWSHPIRGAKEGGVLGALTGFGMGIGGLVLKDIAAFLGPGAYFMKGLNEEHMKKYQPTNFLRRARIIQGQKELADLDPQILGGKSGNVAGSGDEKKGLNRREVENLVSTKWEGMQAKIAQDRHHHQSGIRAALLGRSQRKGGTAIPRKSSRPNSRSGNDQPKKAPSAPIHQAEKLQDVEAKEGGAGHGVDRTSTAPVTATQWKEKVEKKKKHHFEGVDNAKRQEAKEQSAPKQNVPNVFEASLQGDGQPVGGGHSVLGNSHLTGGEAKTIEHEGNPESGTENGALDSYRRKRTTSDTTDWATRKSAERDERRSALHAA